MAKKTTYAYDGALEVKNFYNNLDFTKHDKEEAKLNPFPPEDILLQFSDIVYSDYANYNKNNFKIPDGWELLAEAKSKSNGYFAAAFWNPKLYQFVIANRGTGSWKAKWADVKLYTVNETEQAQSAITFSYIIRNKLKENFDNKYFQVSITGHSLGGWLAQIQTFAIKYLKKDENSYFVRDEEFLNNIHAHTVVFESPGCREGLFNLTEAYRQGPYGDFKTLDITTFLSEWNMVNKCLEPIGLIYYMSPTKCTFENKENIIKKFLKKVIHPKKTAAKWYFRGHSCEEIKLWFNNPERDRLVLIDFPIGKREITKLLLFGNYGAETIDQDYDASKFSLNVFNEKEREFLDNWNKLKMLKGIVNLGKYRVPEFEIDKTDCTIKVSDKGKLLETIGHLKQIEHSAVIDNALNEVIDTSESNFRELSEIARLPLEDVKFNTMVHFEDVYQIKQHFTNNNSMLIHTKSKSDSLEISIINNILCSDQINEVEYLQNHEFLNLNYFSTVKKMIERTSSSKLFILKVCDTALKKIDAIKKCVNSNPKVRVIFVILSNQEFFEDQQLEINQTEGISHNLKFDHLTNSSQIEILENILCSFETDYLRAVIDQDRQHLKEFLTMEVLLEILFQTNNEKLVVFKRDLTSSVGMHQEVKKVVENNENFLRCIGENVNECVYIITKTDLSVTVPPNNDNVINLMDGPKEITNFADKIIYYWLTINNNKIFIDKIYHNELYLPRNILYNKIMNSSCIKHLSNHQFIFIEDEDDENKNKAIIENILENKNVCIEETFGDAIKHFANEDNENVHIFKIKNGKLIWWKSKGKIDRLRDLIETEESISEEVFRNKIDEDQVVIISDESGTGKSITTTNIFCKLQKKSPLVFLISLRSCTLKDIKSEITEEVVIKFLFQASNISSTKLDTALLTYSLRFGKLPLYILFDGYNEIYDDQQAQAFIKLVKYLISETSAKVLITTRQRKEKRLENELSVLESKLKKLQDTELIDFCTTFWYDQLILTETNREETMRKIKSSAIKLLKHITSQLQGRIADFLGIPLQLNIAAQTVTPHFILEGLEGHFDFENVLELYQSYIRTHFGTYFQRYLKTDPSPEYIKQSLLNLFNSNCRKIATAHRFQYNLNEVSEEDVAELNVIGIVKDAQVHLPQFGHDTIMDYYAAEWLIICLNSPSEISNSEQRNLIINIFFKSDLNIMRYFLNGLLKLNDVELKFQYIFDFWKDNPDDFFLNEESSLHVAVKDNLDSIVEKLLLPIFNNMDDKIRFFAKHNYEEDTVLQLAFREESGTILRLLLKTINEWPEEDILEMLLASLFHTFETNKVDTDQFKKMLNYFSNCQGEYANISKKFAEIKTDLEKKNKFFQFIISSKTDQFKNILDNNNKLQSRYLQLITKTDKQSILHLAASHNQSLTIIALNDLKCDLDIQDYHGMTPLARAAQKGSFQAVLTLMNHGAKDDIYDLSQVSPFMHASKRGYLKILEVMIERKNNSNATEKYLLHKDKFGITAFAYATMNGWLEIVKYLAGLATYCFGKEAALATMIDLKDKNDMTPLQYATKRNCKWKIKLKLIQFLVSFDEGVKINTCSERTKMTPLLYSIQCKNWNVVVYLINKGADVQGKTKDGTSYLKFIVRENKKHPTKAENLKVLKKIGKVLRLMIEKGAETSDFDDEEKKYLEQFINK